MTSQPVDGRSYQAIGGGGVCPPEEVVPSMTILLNDILTLTAPKEYKLHLVPGLGRGAPAG